MNRSLSLALAPLWLAATAQAANTAPTVVIQSATMRGATGLMDVVFRVNDPDDATVKTRALAFRNGTRSFANLVKPSTFADGTASKIGDAIATNTNHTLTWNVATDWNIDLGQIKFEILAMDGRGLLPLDWVTIPAANGQPELTISKHSPSLNDVMNALFWQYASGDPGLTLENGVLRGSENSGVFAGVPLAGGSTYTYATPFIAKRMNLALADERQLNYLNRAGRTSLSPDGWRLLRQNYSGTSVILSSAFEFKTHEFSVRATNGNTLSGGQYPIVINIDGTVVRAPDEISNIVDGLYSGPGTGIAIKSDGTLTGWGSGADGLLDFPIDIYDVKSVTIWNSREGYSVGIAIDGSRNLRSWGGASSNLTESQVITNIPNASKLYSTLGNSYYVWCSDKILYRISPDKFRPFPSVDGIAVDCIDVSCAYSHIIAIQTDRSIRFWGSMFYPAEIPQIPQEIGPSRQVATSRLYSMSLAMDGVISVLPHGHLEPPNDRVVPTLPPGLIKADAITIDTGDNAIIFRAKAL